MHHSSYCPRKVYTGGQIFGADRHNTQRKNAKIIKVSRERYGTPRTEVEEKIAKWAAGLEAQKTSGVSSAPQMPQKNQILYDARCVNCGKDTKVIFPPDGKRPVYCKSCLSKIKNKDSKANNTQVQPQKPVQVPTISLGQALKNEPVSFSHPKKITPMPEVREKIKRKEVNLDELKKVLEESLRKTQNNNENPTGV